MLSANFRWTTHSNNINDYIQGYQSMQLCSATPDILITETHTDEYALVTATILYRKGGDCAVSPLNLTFHMLPAIDQAFWSIDRVELR